MQLFFSHYLSKQYNETQEKKSFVHLEKMIFLWLYELIEVKLLLIDVFVLRRRCMSSLWNVVTKKIQTLKAGDQLQVQTIKKKKKKQNTNIVLVILFETLDKVCLFTSNLLK